MMKVNSLLVFLFSFLFLNLNCGSGSLQEEKKPTASLPGEFANYWYQGKAEITSYELQQARYGEVHKGHAVLIFVTEPFSRSKHVKLDNAATAGDDAVTVMKCNFTKKFNTGIYPYSMMMSSFTPVSSHQFPHTLKTTCTSQEWCGHTFTQFNLQDNEYEVVLRSYFESEGDKNIKLDKAWLEDEIWSRIRLNPKSLPMGEFKIIPGTFYQRLKHTKFAVNKCKANLEKGQKQSTYTLSFVDMDRKLSITFNNQFPHEIESWEEVYQSGFGPGAKKLVTKALKRKRILADYWNKNSVADSTMRKELGLD